LEVEVEPAEAPKTLEDGGQATVDELKELNLGTKEDPRPIYMSTMLTPEEKSSTSIYSPNIEVYFHGVTKKCLVWTLKLRFTIGPSGRVFRLKNSLNGVFVPN